MGFDADSCAVFVALDKQSADIAMGVDKALEAKENQMSDSQIEAIGAGDQGMMFGYATNETEAYMPFAIDLAHKLCLQLTKVRKDGTLKYLRPDGKSQVSVEYQDGKPVRLEAVVLSTQHDAEVTQEQIHEDIKKYVFDPVLPKDMLDENTKYFINPTGRFVIGGPHGDAGLTGRKIIVDTYGGAARHGGGAFSGKDCTKVDRSAAYAARYVAKNIVAAGLADKCEIQLSYAIGVAQPTSVMVDTFGTGRIADEKLTDIPAIASVRQNYKDNYLGYAYNAYNYSTARVADGGFIRMKDISLTYDFLPQFISKIGLTSASLKLDATNLFLIYADKKLNGQDPEFVNSGGVATPLSKQFTFTVRLGI